MTLAWEGAVPPFTFITISLLLLQDLLPSTNAALELNDVVKLGSVDRAATLLADGARVSSRDTRGWTPLHNAANAGNVELVKLLLEYHAKTDVKDPNGRTALHLAADNGQEEVTATLLKAGATTNASDVNDQTPLHLATWNGHLSTSLLLLKEGADINAQDKYGSTPLRLATIQGFDEIIKALLLFCPDLRLLDNKGVTAVEFAKKKELSNIISIFEEYRRRPCSRHKLQNVGRRRRVHLTPNNGERGGRCSRGEKQYPDEHISYSWRLKDTAAGDMTDISCPAGTNGSATWTCDVDGRWHRTPNLSKCHSLLFSGWQEGLATDNVTAAEIITTIATSLRDARRDSALAPGDLITIGGILGKLHTKHIQDLQRLTSGIEAWKLTMRFLNGTMESVDTMLTKPALWWGLNQQSRDTTFTQLQESVAFATNNLATHQMDSMQEFSVHSLFTRVMHRPVEYFKSIRLSFVHPDFNQTTLTLPYNFYDTYQGKQNTLKVVFVAYNGLHCTVNTVPCSPNEVVADRDLPAASQVNSAIVGASVGDGLNWYTPLGEMVIVKLQHVYLGDKYLLGERTCVWWDVSANTWVTDGCHLVDTNDHFSLCHCNHLTNLAVIMDIDGVIDNTHVMHRVMYCVTIVSCVVSIVSLAICVVCFLAFRDIRQNMASVIHGNLCLCLMISEMVVLAGIGPTHNKLTCTVVAALLHYFFLATFVWSSIEAFHMYLNFIKVFKTKVSPLKYYLMVGYLVPLVYIILTLAFTHTQGQNNDKVCWLSPQGLIWSFVGPLAATLLFNASAFLMTMFVAWCRDPPETPPQSIDYSKSSSTKSTRSRDTGMSLWENLNSSQQTLSSAKRKHSGSSGGLQKLTGGKCAKGSHGADGSSNHTLGSRIRGSLSVLLLICLTWLSGFLYFLDGRLVLALIFTLLNSMQGLGIFLIHIVMNPRIMLEVRTVLK